MQLKLDSEYCVPFTDSIGTQVMTYDNPCSVYIKCDYIKENGLLGVMYWSYQGITSKVIQENYSRRYPSQEVQYCHQ